MSTTLASPETKADVLAVLTGVTSNGLIPESRLLEIGTGEWYDSGGERSGECIDDCNGEWTGESLCNFGVVQPSFKLCDDERLSEALLTTSELV
ncbi:unnamed protein product [Heterobilharzia americana]|nr:unnamed protein product [Heterobilharzia americana]